MLYGEWKLEEALVVEREEGLEEGLEKGRVEIVKNALTKGVSVEFLSEITGLSTATIQELAAR